MARLCPDCVLKFVSNIDCLLKIVNNVDCVQKFVSNVDCVLKFANNVSTSSNLPAVTFTLLISIVLFTRLSVKSSCCVLMASRCSQVLWSVEGVTYLHTHWHCHFSPRPFLSARAWPISQSPALDTCQQSCHSLSYLALCLS